MPLSESGALLLVVVVAATQRTSPYLVVRGRSAFLTRRASGAGGTSGSLGGRGLFGSDTEGTYQDCYNRDGDEAGCTSHYPLPGCWFRRESGSGDCGSEGNALICRGPSILCLIDHALHSADLAVVLNLPSPFKRWSSVKAPTASLTRPLIFVVRSAHCNVLLCSSSSLVSDLV